MSPLKLDHLNPTDAEVRDQFVSNREKFIQLKNMLDTDWYVVGLDNEDVFYANDSEETISSERLSHYRKILSDLKP